MRLVLSRYGSPSGKPIPGRYILINGSLEESRGVLPLASGVFFGRSDGMLSINQQNNQYCRKVNPIGRSLNLTSRNDTIWIATPEGIKLMDTGLNILAPRCRV